MTSNAESLGHRFNDEELLRQALTHRSAGVRNYERLEFLGDALVNMLIAHELFQRWPRADEGTLTRARADLVRESSLAAIARTLNLGDRLELGPGELKSGGYRRDSILADALEAVAAAIYLDGGFDAFRNAVLPWFEPSLASVPARGSPKDAKTRLQEWLQRRQAPLPTYELAGTEGEEHCRTFHVRCRTVEPPIEAYGEGGSRRQAEQSAAAALLERIEQEGA